MYPDFTYSVFNVKKADDLIMVEAKPVSNERSEKGEAFLFYVKRVIQLLIFFVFGILPFFIKLPIPISKDDEKLLQTIILVVFSLAAIWVRNVTATEHIIGIDTTKQILRNYGAEVFDLNLADIQEISVFEDVNNKGKSELKLYRLKYKLTDGERTSGFAFTTSLKAQELVNTVINLFK